MRTIWQAYRELISLEYSIFRKDFSFIYNKVRDTRVSTFFDEKVSVEQVCHAIDIAAAFYFKQTLCLQRSAAAACLLRRHGFAAELVIGVQQVPFLAHAWVELDGLVVNDKPYMSDMYSVLTRC